MRRGYRDDFGLMAAKTADQSTPKAPRSTSAKSVFIRWRSHLRRTREGNALKYMGALTMLRNDFNRGFNQSTPSVEAIIYNKNNQIL